MNLLYKTLPFPEEGAFPVVDEREACMRALESGDRCFFLSPKRILHVMGDSLAGLSLSGSEYVRGLVDALRAGYKGRLDFALLPPYYSRWFQDNPENPQIISGKQMGPLMALTEYLRNLLGLNSGDYTVDLALKVEYVPANAVMMPQPFHRDGRDFVVVCYLGRENIRGGLHVRTNSRVPLRVVEKPIFGPEFDAYLDGVDQHWGPGTSDSFREEVEHPVSGAILHQDAFQDGPFSCLVHSESRDPNARHSVSPGVLENAEVPGWRAVFILRASHVDSSLTGVRGLEGLDELGGDARKVKRAVA